MNVTTVVGPPPTDNFPRGVFRQENPPLVLVIQGVTHTRPTTERQTRELVSEPAVSEDPARRDRLD